MSDSRIDTLEREIRNDRMCSIRMRLLLGAYVMWSVVPNFRSIFQSMNVELPAATKMALWSSAFVEDWFLVLMPLAWVLWRVFEDRFVVGASPARLRVVRHVLTMGLIALAFALYMPMMKLINNVG